MNIQDHPCGDSLEIDVPIKDPEGNAADLTGATLTYTIRKRYRAIPVHHLTVGSGIEIREGSIARVTVPAGLLNIAGDWVHSIELARSDLWHQTLWVGLVGVIHTARPQ